MEKSWNTDGKQFVDKLAEKVVLRLYSVGGDQTNYAILKILPKTPTEIAEELGLSAMPINKRLKDLKEAGIVRQDKQGQPIELSELGNIFVNDVKQRQISVIKYMADLI